MSDEDPVVSAAREVFANLGDAIEPDYLMKLVAGPEAVRADRVKLLRAVDAQTLQELARSAGHAALDSAQVARAVEIAHNVAEEDLAAPTVLIGVSAAGDAGPKSIFMNRAGHGKFLVGGGPGDQHLAAIRDLAESVGISVPTGTLLMQIQVVYDGARPDVRLSAGDINASRRDPAGRGMLVPLWTTSKVPTLRAVDDRVYPPAEFLHRPYYCAVVLVDDQQVLLIASWDLAANVPDSMKAPAEGEAKLAESAILAEASALWDALLAEFGSPPGDERGKPIWSRMMALSDAIISDEKTPLRSMSALKVTANRIPGDAAVIYGDLNRFKRLNDDYGHRAGDAAIAHFGRLLQAIARPFTAWCFRESGDEFVVIAPIRHAEGLLADLSRILRSAPFEYEGKVHSLSMSFGWCELAVGEAFEVARRHAEVACDVAKDAGDGEVVKWAADLRAQERVTHRFRCACGARFHVSLRRAERVKPLRCPACGKEAT